MVFELDSQSANQPRHWREDDSWIGPRTWLTGQAVALREAAWHSRVDPDPAPDAQETALALAWLLSKVTATESSLPKILEPTSSDLEPIQRQADDLAQHAALWRPTVDGTMSMLRSLAATDLEFTSRGKSVEAPVYRARRVVLALDRLSVALNANAAGSLKIGNELKALYEDLKTPDVFNPVQFAQHLRAFQKAL